MGTKYLIYLDILGFRNIPIDLSEVTRFPEDTLRERFLSEPLEKVIEDMKRESLSMFKGVSELEGSDNYIIVIRDLDGVFEVVRRVISIGLPRERYIPMQVAVDIITFDESINVQPINRTQIIDSLRNNIISVYRDYYRQKNSGISPKDTFILFTPKVYDQLEYFEKKLASEIVGGNEPLGPKLGANRFFLVDIDKFRVRCKLRQFLREIGYDGNKWYGRIDEVYTPPLEFQEIQETLRRTRIVFLTGTQEFGKTYTAVRLLWEYYCQGYTPRWIKGGDVSERAIVAQRLENIASELRPRHILYFEDPFGKIKYDRREGLEREINTIIASVSQINDVYVIITSREEVFKEFEKEQLSKEDFSRLERRLNIKRASYDIERRKDMLLKWAKSENSIWLKTNAIKKMITDSLGNSEILPTPFSIRKFAISATKIQDVKTLRSLLDEMSSETAHAFAQEIRNLTPDKVLFLSIVFSLKSAEYDLAYRTYAHLVRDLALNDAWEFDAIVKWFSNDKINYRGEKIEFSHPSYREAFYLVVTERRHLTQINKTINNKVIMHLSREPRATYRIASAIVDLFDYLSEDIRDILYVLVREGNTGGSVADVIRNRFDELPVALRNELLILLSQLKQNATTVDSIIAGKFRVLPERLRHILLTHAQDSTTSVSVANALAEHFDELPIIIRNKLFAVVSETCLEPGSWAKILTTYYHKLPQGVRNKMYVLLSNKECGELVGDFIYKEFYRLPKGTRCKLLVGLARNGFALQKVGLVLSLNYELLPRNVRTILFDLVDKKQISIIPLKILLDKSGAIPRREFGRLLLMISGKGELPVSVSSLLEQNFDKIDASTRNTLIRSLVRKGSCALVIARILVGRYETLPRRLRKEVLNILSKNIEAKQVLAEFLEAKFDKVGVRSRNMLLLTLCNYAEASSSLVKILISRFDEIGAHVRDQVLLALAAREDTAFLVARLLDDRPSKIRESTKCELLEKLAHNDKMAWWVAQVIYDDFPFHSRRVRNLMYKLLTVNQVAIPITELFFTRFDQIPRRVRNRMLQLLSEEPTTVAKIAGFIESQFDKIPDGIRERLLIIMAESDVTCQAALRILAERSLNLESSVIAKLLYSISERHEIAQKGAYVIAKYFSKLDKNDRLRLLCRLAENEDCLWIVFLIAIGFYKKIPEELASVLRI